MDEEKRRPALSRVIEVVMDNLSQVIPSSVNDEVVIFRGCTTTELLVLFAGSAAFWLPLTVLIGFMVGSIFLVASLSMVLMLMTVGILSTVLQNIKQGKPDGYYQQKLRLFFGEKKMIKQPYFVHDGVLSIERSECLVFLQRDLKIDKEEG